MKNKLDTLGKSLEKDTKESNTNTRRIQANFPQIERKLDIVSNAYSFKMYLPVTDTSSSISLNIYIKPDNCCECDMGGITGTRQITGNVTEFQDIDRNYFTPNLPVENPFNGIEYQGLITSYTTAGTLDSIWFAWPGYPWFHPYPGMEEDASENAFGDFFADVTSRYAISVPVSGVYTTTYTGSVSGTTTTTSKITVMLKTVSGANDWVTISKQIYAVEYGTLQPNSPLVAFSIKISAICYGLYQHEIIGVWIKGENIDNLSFGDGVMRSNLMGMGWGQVSGHVYHDAPNLNPIMGATVSVRLVGYDVSAMTDLNGYYVLTGVLPGRHTIIATYSTFSTSQKVTIERNRLTDNINFIL